LAQGAIDQYVMKGYPAGTTRSVVFNLTHAEASPPDTITNGVSMLMLIARKDYMSNSQDNQQYVDGELSVFVQNDTW
jgi:hypothetical protein